MANYERDKDDLRVFDGGDDEDGEGSHLPVVIIIAILVLAAFGGVVWLAYNQGVARGRSDIPVQVASNQSGKGSQIKVYQQPAGSEDEEDVQTAPANPQTAEPILRKEQPSAPSQETQVAQTAPAPVASPSPAAAAPAKPAPQPQMQATKPPAPLGLAHPAEPTSTSAQAAPVKPVAAAAPKPPAPKPAAAVAPKTVATAAPKPAAPKPVAAAAAPKPVAAVAPKPVAAVVAPKPAAVAPAAVTSGSYLLQVGAYKSQDEAMAAWKAYQSKHSSLLKGLSPDVQRADLGGKGVWYRLRVSSFADKNAAAALCDRLKAENGACFLAR
ncbi:MAG TPA: SPOR domain-containing protein [Rhizomicrobium sp.]|nr:SPOR domain-containing protein [Rhizomicrobium sp.]